MGILIEEKLMLQFKMYYLKVILFIAQKAAKESLLDEDSRENDKVMALEKSLLVKVAIQMKLKIKGLNIIQSFPEEKLALNQMQFRVQKVLSLNHQFPPFQQLIVSQKLLVFHMYLYLFQALHLKEELLVEHLDRRDYWGYQSLDQV